MSKKITLKKVAEAAKVSLATASRVMNKTGRVSPQAERQVRSAALKLGAGSSRPGHTQTLCFLLANRSMLHPFHAQVLMGAQGFAAEHGKHILFYPFHYAADTPPDEIRLPLLDAAGMADGYIVGGVNTPNLLKKLGETGIPYAVLGNNVAGDWQPDRCDAVWMDDASGAFELTVYLQGLGHRRICFLGTHQFPTVRMEQGYRHAMEQARLEPQVIENDSKDERESGYLAAKGLFSRRGGVTALCTYSDAAAHGVYEAATVCGLRIPDDISIAGFGDRPEASALTPSLTTVWGYPDQVGRRLAEMVLNRLSDPAAAARSVVLPTKLIQRNSCQAIGEIESNPPPKTAARELLPAGVKS